MGGIIYYGKKNRIGVEAAGRAGGGIICTIGLWDMIVPI
jgi:hypothetical protein